MLIVKRSSMQKFRNIALHIPHSSDRLPEGCVWSGDLRKALDRWTDWSMTRWNRWVRESPTKTIMIEVNKSVYLAPDGITPGSSFNKIHHLIEELYLKLLGDR